MLPPAQADALGHLLESARRLLAYLEGMDRAGFEADLRTQDAVIRRFEILGEACVRLGPAFHAAHPAVPWRQLRAMRNVLAHAYDRMNLEVVWTTARQDVPALVAAVEAIFAAEGLAVPPASPNP